MRQRYWVGGSLTVAILAIGLAGLAYWQRGVAVAEQARAERNFNAAKSTIDLVVFDLAQGLRNVEGMQAETVRRILGRAETAVGQLASRTGNDPEVRRSQAAMFSLFSETYLNLGATELAADYARKSMDIMRALLVTQPGNTGWQRDLSLSLNRVGTALAAEGDRPGALAAYRESLDIMRALVAKGPSNAEWQHGVSESLSGVGDILVAQGDLTGALAAFREAVDIMRTVVVKDPRNTEWQRDLTVALQRIGLVLEAQGDLTGALGSYREELDIASALAAKDPGNEQFQRDVQLSLQGVGNVLGARGDLTGKLAAYNKGLDIARALCQGPGEYAMAARRGGEPA